MQVWQNRLWIFFLFHSYISIANAMIYSFVKIHFFHWIAARVLSTFLYFTKNDREPLDWLFAEWIIAQKGDLICLHWMVIHLWLHLHWKQGSLKLVIADLEAVLVFCSSYKIWAGLPENLQGDHSFEKKNVFQGCSFGTIL